MKTTNSLFPNKNPLKIRSLQINKEKLLIDNFSLFKSLCVSLLFERLVEIKIESRLHGGWGLKSNGRVGKR